MRYFIIHEDGYLITRHNGSLPFHMYIQEIVDESAYATREKAEAKLKRADKLGKFRGRVVDEDELKRLCIRASV